jgi:hypothetical protein
VIGALILEEKMRYAELFEQRKPERLTLKNLNRMKFEKRRLERELAEKQRRVGAIYANHEIEAERAERRNKELKLIRDEIWRKIDGAKIDRKDKEKIRAMALKALKVAKK